jgi:CDP-diacylglycerol--serine O-phosphatidyltransferase
MLRKRPRRIRALPVNSLIPNILTVLALCAGMSAIRFALQDRWELAVAAVAVAALLDGLDGRMARLLKGATKFGAELDSLSDFICFGVAPGIVVYLWAAAELGNMGWIAGLAYSTCCALRLARFNTALEDPDRPAWAANFFTGVSAPVGAAFALLPMMISFQIGDTPLRTPWLMTGWLVAVGLLMISRIPSYSFKRIRIKREYVLPTLVGVGFVAAILVSYPWFILSAASLLYLLSLPFSYRSHVRYERTQEEAVEGGGGETAAATEEPR